MYRGVRDIGSSYRERVDIVRRFGMMGIVEMSVPRIRLRHIKTG